MKHEAWIVCVALLATAISGCLQGESSPNFDPAANPTSPRTPDESSESVETRAEADDGAASVTLLEFNGTVIAASTSFGQPGPSVEHERATEGSIGRDFFVSDNVTEFTVIVNETGGPAAGSLSFYVVHEATNTKHAPAFDGLQSSRRLSVPDPAEGAWSVWVRAAGVAVMVEYEGLVVLTTDDASRADSSTEL